MTENKIPRICTPTDGYERHYPEFVELANIQLEKQLWFSSEMKVGLDRMQLKYELEPDQKFAVEFVLNLFVQYELQVGEMWSKLSKLFPRPEVKLMCSVFEMTERAIHAEFYNQINVALGLDKDEDYTKFLKDPVLAQRAKWLGEMMNHKDPILGAIIFSLTETGSLFSSFSILKSHQVNGYNKIPVVVRGTNQSAIDEDLHGMGSAAIINRYYYELGYPLREDKERVKEIYEAVKIAYEHEEQILNIAIRSGKLNGTTLEEFKTYVKSRFNLWLTRLGLDPAFEIGDNPVAGWFENNTYAFKMPDFFTAGMPMEYESAWDKEAFKSAWIKKIDIVGGELQYGAS